MRSSLDAFGRTAPRTSAARSFGRLYRSDGLFRSSLDFAVIGLAVYWFVAPLPMPSLDWLKRTGASNSAPGNAASGSIVPTNGSASSAPPVNTADIAQAATPARPVKLVAKVRREWFKLSDPAIVPALHQAADQIDNGIGAAARKIIDEIARPGDPNVLNLSAYVHLMSREKGAMQRAYEDHFRAAEAGHPESMDQVGQIVRMGQAGRVDVAAAVDWYERGAAAGSASAATNSGRAYVNGWARPVNFGKAAQYYLQAAEAGDNWGMHNYGGMLVNGHGVAQDAEAGRRWIEKSANTGLSAAQHTMAKLARTGIGGPRDFDAFLRWAQAAADQGLAPAIYDLGVFYLKPDDGRQADPARAAGYLRQAAMKKHAAAQFAYATLCERGVGIPANPVQAFVYYSLALRGGEASAQSRLDALRDRMAPQEIETAQKLVAAASS
jgi:TPR repeat protein